MKKYIPNALTLLNLFCGSIAVVFAVNNNFVAASVFVFLGIFFDFFDGFFARKFKVQSELGVQLDSLADMVTSGVVPGIFMFKLLALAIDRPEVSSMSDEWNSILHFEGVTYSIIPFFGLFITLASAYRLAKFNIDEDPQSYYLLNSNIKLFALKFKEWGFKANASRYIFIMLCIVFLIILQFAAIPMIILLYIGMSLLDSLTAK